MKNFYFLMLVTLCSSAHAFSATNEGCFVTSEFSPGWINDYICSDQDIVIPSQIDGVKITSIGMNAFSSKKLTSVQLPNGLEYIGLSAFYGNNLLTIQIPSSVTSISLGAFASNQLTDITFPESLKKIGDNAFAGNQLTSVKLPNVLGVIGSGAFANNHINHLELPQKTPGNNGLVVNAQAFSGNNLTSVKFTTDVFLSTSAFEYNQITQVDFAHNSIVYIQSNAFAII